jgi:hypothetical protein
MLFFLATIDREYILLSKDETNEVTPVKITSFNGLNQAYIVNETDFSGHFNNEFTIRMLMKHSSDNKDKEHIFCKSDEKCK